MCLFGWPKYIIFLVFYIVIYLEVNIIIIASSLPILIWIILYMFWIYFLRKPTRTFYVFILTSLPFYREQEPIFLSYSVSTVKSVLNKYLLRYFYDHSRNTSICLTMFLSTSFYLCLLIDLVDYKIIFFSVFPTDEDSV